MSGCWGALKGRWRGVGSSAKGLRSGSLTLDPKHTIPKGHAPLPPASKGSPAWKSMPTAREVPDTGTRASDLSLGSRGIPRIPSCTEYRRKEPTPETQEHCRHEPHRHPFKLGFCHPHTCSSIQPLKI